ncbi:hypothetical protein ACLKA6_008514 [Drosophila palustris]
MFLPTAARRMNAPQLEWATVHALLANVGVSHHRRFHLYSPSLQRMHPQANFVGLSVTVSPRNFTTHLGVKGGVVYAIIGVDNPSSTADITSPQSEI